ncbi:MAG TPA: glutamyl-tRNA reductase [Acidimicrobiales bacterium]|nr:glutamyl-tRNA reductase [Acidimicrobiales bacterium]
MSVIVVGLNHRSVPLEVLERMTVPRRIMPKALADLTSRDDLTEAVVLSTCNRTEVYAHAERFHGAVGAIRDFLADLGSLAPEDFADHLYQFHDAGAVAHLFTVAAGVDSAVVGETEILGQVKGAWEAAAAEGAAGPALNMLFRHALEAGKRVRTETSISRHITSLSQAAVALAAERLGSLQGRRVLVLGAGDTGEGMVGALAQAGVADVLVANRTWERAEALALRVGGRALGLAEVPAALTEVDLLLTSTGASSVLVDHGDLEGVVAARGGRPLLIVDVAVPRDVDPGAADLVGVTLLDMDDLRAFAEQGLTERRREVGRARDLIDDEVCRYREASTARLVAPLVTSLRRRVDTLCAAEVERVGRALEADQRLAVEAAVRSVVAKVLHEPTIRLKDAGGTPRGERLSEALRDLFDLGDEP